MRDLITLTKRANAASAYASFPRHIPVLLVSGKEDVVGGCGKGVLTVEKQFNKRGVPVRTVLYEGARHEILNDFTREAVIKEMLSFLTSQASFT